MSATAGDNRVSHTCIDGAEGRSQRALLSRPYTQKGGTRAVNLTSEQGTGLRYSCVSASPGLLVSLAAAAMCPARQRHTNSIPTRQTERWKTAGTINRVGHQDFSKIKYMSIFLADAMRHPRSLHPRRSGTDGSSKGRNKPSNKLCKRCCQFLVPCHMLSEELP